jgi:RNA polymerase sigma-B factor
MAHRRQTTHRRWPPGERGDANAREALIVGHLPLARRLAMRYRRGHQPVDDLIQVASLGLVRAVDRWDPDRGVAFATYAVPTILGELRRFFRDATWDVRPPRDVQDLSLSIRRAREQLYGALGREPTVADLTERLDRSPEEVTQALQAGDVRTVWSLDIGVDDEESGSATVGDLIGHEDDAYERVEARATIERVTSILDDRAREILRLHFEDDLLQSEIAERLGVSPRRVSRILRASLDKLSAYCSGGGSASSLALVSD